MLTSCLTTIKNHVIKYCEKVNERSGKNLFWSIKNSCEVLNQLKSRGFRASSLSTYDFSTLYTTLPHNLIKDKLVDLIERTFQREGSLYIACNDRNAFFTSDAVRNYNLWSCQNVCEALTFLLDNIYIRSGSKLYRKIVGIPMGTNCAPLVADLFLFCYERDFMLSLSEDNESGVIEAFNSTSRYLDDLLNIDNNFFDSMVNRIYPSELQLNKANVSDAEASFLDLHLSISDGFVKTKIYDKRDDFDFDIVKGRKANPQKLTQLSSRSHPRHVVGKRTAQKDITTDTTSDSQVNSNFPNRWSPASLTFNNYFYLILYLYIT